MSDKKKRSKIFWYAAGIIVLIMVIGFFKGCFSGCAGTPAEAMKMVDEPVQIEQPVVVEEPAVVEGPDPEGGPAVAEAPDPEQGPETQ